MTESRPLSGRVFRVESFDTEPAWAATGTILSGLRVGDRTDWAWARVDPPLRVYLCRAIDASKVMAEELRASDLAIEYWATVQLEPAHEGRPA